jgi:tRNA dimethylallyltransferase
LVLAVARVRGVGVPPVELVSVDSMAVYRGMDIGTAKPTAEVRSEVPYHLIDLVDPSDEFTVQQFQAAALSVLAGIAERGHRALLVGGTGLYLRSLIDDLTFPGRFPDVAAALVAELEGAGPSDSLEAVSALAGLHARLADLDPVAAARMEPTNRRRVMRALEVTIGSGRPFSSFGPGLEAYPETRFALVGLPLADDIDRRIEERFAAQMEAGFLDEVRELVGRPGGLSRTARQALGYRELLSHLEGGVPLDAALSEAIRRTRVFARRQWAWFRRDPRIVWVGEQDDPVARVIAAFAGEGSHPVGN